MSLGFVLLSHIIRTDKESTDMQDLLNVLRQGFGFHEDEAHEAMRLGMAARQKLGDAETAAKNFLRAFAEKCPEAIFDITSAMLWLCETPEGWNQKLISEVKKITSIFGISSEDLESIVQSFEHRKEVQNRYDSLVEEGKEKWEGKKNLDEAVRGKKDALRSFYKVLGVNESISDPELYKRYKQLVFERHPDRLNVADLSAKELKEARRAFQDLLSAYSTIKQVRKERGRDKV